MMRPIALVCLLGILGRCHGQELVPFVLPWDDATTGPTDLASWNHRPAGKFGPVRVGDEGHLYAGADRIRFLGVNLCFGACFPEKSAAEKIAARMARFGINCVRFHHMDSQEFPGGIWARGRRSLSPEAVDRLAYFIDQLARHGIYTNLNLLVSRRFSAADGVPAEIEKVDWKNQHLVGFFEPRLLELQQQYARDLLTAENRYSKTPHGKNPAVAFVEINNENGLVHGWLGDDLDELPAPFARRLQQLWNEWLARRYPSTAALRTAWQARNEPPGKPLIRNGDFRQGASGWNLERHEGAEAEAAVSDGPAGRRAVKISVRKLTGTDWHVQFNQAGFALKAGGIYTLRFRAKADRPLAVTAAIGRGHNPWQNLGLQVRTPLSTDWRQFEYVFVAKAADEEARVGLTNLGAQQAAVWLADVELRPGGTVGIGTDETIEAGSIRALKHRSERPQSAPAVKDWIRFLWETERQYWRSMQQFVKESLGVHALVVGTIIATSPPNLQAEFDAVDSHGYWRHPRFPGRPWDSQNWLVENDSMVADPPGVVGRLATQRVLGKPHLVTEYNHAAPNTFSSEAPLFLAALAALQDWDGVFLFAYSHRSGAWDNRAFTSFFDIDQHPLKMANLLPAAALFARGDLAAAPTLQTVDLGPEREIELLASAGRAWRLVDAELLGVPAQRALERRIALRVGAAAAGGSAATGIQPRTDRTRAEAKPLVWDAAQKGKATVRIDTPRTKAFIGFPASRSFQFGALEFTPGPTIQDWCTMGLVLLEGTDFASPGRSLLILTGLAENTGMQWKDERKTSVGRNWGRAPSLVEVVSASLVLPVNAKRARAWTLDERGRRGKPLAIRDKAGKAQVNIPTNANTIWYEIVVE